MMKCSTWLLCAVLVQSGTALAADPAQPPAAAGAERDRSLAVDVAAEAAGAGEQVSASRSVPPPAGAQPATANGQRPAAHRRATTDRLDLDTTVVTGNRELPKVLYIVPWKKADIGELPAQPFNTLLDEVLTPVDRDVFRREVTYYDALSSGAAAPPQSTGSATGGSDSPRK